MKINTSIKKHKQTVKWGAMLSFLLVIFTIGCDSKKEVTYPDNLSQFHDNLMTHYTSTPIENSAIEDLLEGLNEDGSWKSIDYANKRRGRWPVKLHLEHVQFLAIAYQTEGSKQYHSNIVSEKIHTSLNYWLDNDFLSTNWWDQHIGVPELLLPTLFLMENELSKEQLKKAMVLLNRANIKMTGQNKVWLSANVMLRSLLIRNADSVAIASKALQGELKIAKGVGIKPDWSYHEHGAQMQFGNYGLSYLEDMIKWYSILDATPYKFDDTKIDVLRNYILKGQQWVLWNGKMDVNTLGRHLFKDEQTNKYLQLKACFEKMEMLDEAHAQEYKDAMDSKIISGNKHFWESDFQIHRSPNFYFSVKMSSKRVIGTESVNEENIQGYYLGDGVSLLYTNGDEYKNIFPFWDFKKLPGATIIQDDEPLPIIKAWDFKTQSEFVGGVSNNENGISAMNYERDGVKAHKSWFMFGDKIVCLGSGINAETKFPVATTINQVFLKNDLKVSQNNKISGQLEKNQGATPDWILHDGTGYFFSNKGSVKLESKFLAGSWNSVAKRYRPVILTESILRLWFDHGENPKNQSYEYILVPNANEDKMMELTKNTPFKIINSVNQQSVISSDGLLGGIVFYKAGETKLFGGIEVDKACVILVEQEKDGLHISISDPSHKLEKINLKFGATYKNQSVTVKLPEGDYKGSTEVLFLKK
ncbi:chondroitin AC lyase [Lutibacter agarilyticus]|uniref:Chondroitin AC lyase n=2 Tax=Lutibacter agarilyticus TaxID=1109740 RepID=A0A238Z148_9FLAO|nr:chondroitin AC lyase [Lutibacter agarilyticus]